MPVLQSLPVELLRQILANLDPASLRKISLVSHLFHTLAKPFHYASLGTHAQPRTWLLHTLSTLLTRPDLARHVRRITFWYWAEQYPTPANCLLFSAKAAELGIPDIGWWDDAQALFLLHLVPDIQELSFNNTPLLRTFLEQTVNTPVSHAPLQSLVRFTSHAPVTLTMLLALMRLPSMRCITVDMPYRNTYPPSQSAVQSLTSYAGQSSVTQLALHNGETPPSILQLILHIPRALTSFSYMYDREYGCISNTAGLPTILQHLQPALQSLSVGGLYAIGHPSTCEVEIGSLLHWEALTTLECSLPALLGARHTSSGVRLLDVLPLGIRRLFIWRKDEYSALVKAREHWSVWEMTEQLVEVLRNRPVEELTVNTCARVYLAKKGAWKEGWFNQYEERVKQRLTAAAEGRGRCKIVCF